MHIKKTFFIIICVLQNSSLISQNFIDNNLIQKYFKIQEIVLLDSNFDEDNFIFKSISDNLYYLGLRKTSNQQNQYYLGNNKEKENYLIVYNDNFLTSLFNTYKVYDFTIYEDTLIIPISQLLIFFNKNENKYEFIKSIKLHNQIHKINIYNNYLIGYASDPYLNFQGLNRINTYYLLIDLNSYKSEFKQLRNPEGLLLNLLQPRYLINSYNNKIVVSDAIGDSIILNIYDCFLEKNNIRLAYKANNWRTPDKKDKNILEKYIDLDSLKYLKKIIELIRPKLQQFSTVVKVDFINDSTLLIYRSTPCSNFKDFYELEYYFDIIILQNDKINLFLNIQNMTFEKDKPLKYFSKSWEVRNTYHFSEGNLILVEPIPFEFTESMYELSINEVRKKIITFYSRNNKIRYSYIHMKFKYYEN